MQKPPLSVKVWMVKPLCPVTVHAKYTVNTSPATVYSEPVWPLLSFLSLFSFHSECDYFVFILIQSTIKERKQGRPGMGRRVLYICQ